MSNVDRDTLGYRKRKLAIVRAWQLWLHEILTAMEAQRPNESFSKMAVSDELNIMLNELDECRAVGKILTHIDGEEDGQS
jgi:hypothetical protein